MDPFDTPQLGVWLSDAKNRDWDILAAWKLDRLGRNAIQLSKLFGWCQENEKTLVSCSESIDLSNWSGRMLASVIAGPAEGELEAIRERQVGSRRKLRDSGRWPSGRPPFGYAAVKRETGEGWGLEVDPLAETVVHRIVDGMMDGTPLTQIANELNRPPVVAVAHSRSSGGKGPMGPTAYMVWRRHGIHVEGTGEVRKVTRIGNQGTFATVDLAGTPNGAAVQYTSRGEAEPSVSVESGWPGAGWQGWRRRPRV